METQSRPRRRIQITDRDRVLLRFAAVQRFVLAPQAAALLDASVAAIDARMRTLARAGYLIRESALDRQPPTHRITRNGLGAVESPIGVPGKINLGAYRHDAGLGWLYVAAARGRFGPLREIASERHMRSHDWRETASGRHMRWHDRREIGANHYGVHLGGVGPRGRGRPHHPDLVLVDAAGHRVAFELELTAKSGRELDVILSGYAADRRIDGVVYLVENVTIGRAVERAARRVGAADLVGVQAVTLDGRPPRRDAAARSVERAPAHEREAEGRAP